MNRPIDYNFHSHTWRCGHAQGEDFEFIEAPIKEGYKTLGISDHAMFPMLSQPGIRGDYSLLEGYRDDIRALAEKYKDRIKIFLGMECEYMREINHDYFEDLLKRGDVDYLIVGQHGKINETGKWNWYGWRPDKHKEVIEYADDVVSAMASGLFLYIAHPDHYMLWYGDWDEDCEKAARIIAEGSVKYGVPLELNMMFARREKDHPEELPYIPYFNVHFWDIVKEYPVKVVIGIDAHNPKDYAETPFDYVTSFIKERNLNLIDPTGLIEEKYRKFRV